MNLLQDIITYVRRLIKSPSDAVISDNLIIDYINRFWLIDVSARIQLFDLKTQYQFVTTPGVYQYNMPLYNVQTEPGSQTIGSYPVYQGFLDPAFVSNIQIPIYTQVPAFYNIYPNYLQPQAPGQVATGDGTAGPYSFYIPYFPSLPGHVDITGIIATGLNEDPPVNNDLLVSPDAPYNGTYSVIPVTSVNPGIWITTSDSTGANMVITDSGQFLEGNTGYGLLMQPQAAPFGCKTLGTYSTTSNTINYESGAVTVTFPDIVPEGEPINVTSYYMEFGIPRALLFYNNTISLAPPPDKQYVINLTAYLSPCAFLSQAQAIPFGYMAEYIARGAARKLLADTGDMEQFAFYEPLFKEQEALVWKRSQRQFTANRTGTIFSEGMYGEGMGNNNGQGGGT